MDQNQLLVASDFAITKVKKRLQDCKTLSRVHIIGFQGFKSFLSLDFFKILNRISFFEFCQNNLSFEFVGI